MHIKNAAMVIAALAVGAYAWNTSPFIAGIAAPMTPDRRGYVAGRYGLEIDNTLVGWVYSEEGGSAAAGVVVERATPDRVQRKHLDAVKYDEITMTMGPSMSKGFYQRLKQLNDTKVGRVNGAVVSADSSYDEMARLTFQNAVVTEIGFPALDAASKDAAKMTVKLAPELTRFTQAVKSKVGGGAVPKAEKRWLPSNFRLKIDGLDEACARVSKIDAITITQKVSSSAVGGQRDYQTEATPLEYSNIVVTFPESHAKTFIDWHQSFVVEGRNGQDKEKSGTLEYLTPDLQEALFTLTFHNLGIFRLTAEKVEAGGENIRRMKAEMYVEKIDFAYSPNL
jgi:T4-like virus tail tube protein gp19